MAEKDSILRDEDLAQVSGGKKHIPHREVAAFLKQLFAKRRRGRKILSACENPKHKQKQG